MSAAPAATGHPEELIVWVDERDRVLGVVTRARMRAERLRHRAVYIVVVDEADRFVVHQRAPWKDVWPAAWDIAFGGVVGTGEGWEAAASRELAEEAGLVVGPTPVSALVALGEPFRYEDQSVALIGRAYLFSTNEAVVPGDGEVVAVERVPRRQLPRWIRSRLVCPDSLACVLPRLVGPARPVTSSGSSGSSGSANGR